MPDTFEVIKAGGFAKIKVVGNFPTVVYETFLGFFIDVENPNPFEFIFRMFDISENDRENVEMVSTGLVESGYTQIT